MSYRSPRPRAAESVDLRLFCFAHAGGSVASYAGLGSLLPPGIEVRGVDLPGHGTRALESFPSDFGDLISELVDGLSPLTDVPYVLMGHSLGALIAYSIAQRIEGDRKRNRLPSMVVIAGVREPSRIPALPDPEDMNALMGFARLLGGIPEAVWSDSSALSLAARTIRADIRLMRTYRVPDGPPLECNGLLFGGFNDPLVPVCDLEAWQDRFEAAVSLHLLGQGHFFIHTEQAAFARILAKVLRDVVAAPRQADEVAE